MRNLAIYIFALSFSKAALAASLSGYQTHTPDFSQLSLSGNYYLTDNSAKQTSDIYRSNFALNGAWRGTTEGSWLKATAQIEAALSLNKKQSTYLNLREAYLRTTGERFSVALGRQVLNWNNLDQELTLGLFQPRFRWDYLDARVDGLVGGFFHAGNKRSWSFDLYASPIFIPDQGAPFEIENGSCTTSSPWFKCPASSISLFNQSTNVNFILEIPPIRKIIAYGGGGATFWLGESEGFWTRASYAYKPMNQFLLAYEGILSLAQSTPTLPATIRPRVVYHELFGGDIGWKTDEVALTGSFIAENVFRDSTPATWNTQETENARIYGATTKFSFIPLINWDGVGKIAYFQRVGGNADDRGPFASTNGSVFEPRFAFQEALIFELLSPLSQQLANKTKFIWETKTEGNLLSSDLIYNFRSHWQANLGFDIIGTKNISAIEFFSRFQRNDRVRGEVTYVF